MATVFLAGHGSWATADGYTMVPRGCSIEFYTENAKNMFTTDMFDIVKGTYSGSSASKVSQFGSCPNYRLFPDIVNKTKLQQDLQAGARLYMTDDAAGKPLSDIFGQFPEGTDFVWACCRFNTLRDAGGKSVGVNAGQGAAGYYFNPSTTKNTGGFWVPNTSLPSLDKGWDPVAKKFK
jgi:hypothetical protein